MSFGCIFYRQIDLIVCTIGVAKGAAERTASQTSERPGECVLPSNMHIGCINGAAALGSIARFFPQRVTLRPRSAAGASLCCALRVLRSATG